MIKEEKENRKQGRNGRKRFLFDAKLTSSQGLQKIIRNGRDGQNRRSHATFKQRSVNYDPFLFFSFCFFTPRRVITRIVQNNNYLFSILCNSLPSRILVMALVSLAKFFDRLVLCSLLSSF